MSVDPLKIPDETRQVTKCVSLSEYCTNLPLLLGMAFDLVDTWQFKEFYQAARSNKNAEMLTREMYNEHIDFLHSSALTFCGTVFEKEIPSMKGIAFLNLIHDMWTGNDSKSILGASVSFINMNWDKIYMAFMAIVAETDAATEEKIKEQLERCFGAVNGAKIVDSIWSVVSDATTRNVVHHFHEEASDVNCVIHVDLQCAMGLMENSYNDPISRNEVITTPGSDGVPFGAARRVWTKIFKLDDFFHLSERQEKLKSIAEQNNLSFAIANGENEMLSYHKVLQKTLFNYKCYEHMI